MAAQISADAATGIFVTRSTPNSPALAQRLLNIVLFITVLMSFVAFIEPSPHDALMFVLLTACVAARVRFDRRLVPLLLLFIVWLTGGFLSLIQVGDNTKDVQYIGISMYLGVTSLMYACLFSDGNLVRLAILRRAYILAALFATVAGYIGYFHLLPGSEIFLHTTGEGETFTARVSATFKDPNVYGPFLIFAILLLMSKILTSSFKFFDVILAVFLLGGLLLSFSRGAWGHFVFSALICFGLVLAVTHDRRVRGRIIVLGLVTVIIIALVFFALMSIESVRDLFVERAKAIQPYDVGPGGRFSLQRHALSVILDHPNGLGPFEFDRIFGVQQHNEYMQGFLVYGWLGGATYMTMVVITLVVGLRAALISTPWQYYLITAYAVFVGEVSEGMIVDTDHWRHFFLLLGLIWGLTVATYSQVGRQQSAYFHSPAQALS